MGRLRNRSHLVEQGPKGVAMEGPGISKEGSVVPKGGQKGGKEV